MIFRRSADIYMSAISRLEEDITLFEAIRGAMIFQAYHQFARRRALISHPGLSEADLGLVIKLDCILYFKEQDHQILNICGDIYAEDLTSNGGIN